MRNEYLCISILRVASGPRVKLASCESALNPSVVYSTDRSKAVVPVLVFSLLLCGLFYEAICFMSYLVLFCSCVFQIFKHYDYLAWGRESYSKCFSYVCSICACLVLSVFSSFCAWEGLSFVIVALPGLFSYLLE